MSLKEILIQQRLKPDSTWIANAKDGLKEILIQQRLKRNQIR